MIEHRMSKVAQPEVESSLDLKIPEPQIISLAIKEAKPKVKSFYFDSTPLVAVERRTHSSRDSKSAANKQSRQNNRASSFRPPRDIIKVKDRLFFVLQPSLESLIDSSEIKFPFEPFPHQYSGVAFLFPRQAAILADEMGLGKTMQAITAIRLLIRSGSISNLLLVCPKPLVTNWQREFKTWAPELNVCTIEGDQSKRTCAWRADLPIKICNYELLLRDQLFFDNDETHFDLVVLDEAQRIKNSYSTISKTVRSLRRRRSWALTGTPVENSPQDLVGIFEFLSSGHLHAEMPVHKIASEARDFILRRTKDQVLDDMPPKLNRDADLELTEQQAATYHRAENDGVIRLNEIGEGLTVSHVFELVLRLKQICNFDPVTGASCKLQRLSADLAEVIASGQKAIIFSQWVKTIDKIAEAIPEANPLEYHGKIPSKKRDGILQQFKEDPKRHVLLMSYGAGSVGLNLQFCRYVFLFDRWWNPAVEDQAINRAHRLGSAGSVTITRFLTRNTIEERINEVLEAKRELFETMLAGTDHPQNCKLTKDDVFGLFNLSTPEKPIGKVA